VTAWLANCNPVSRFQSLMLIGRSERQSRKSVRIYLLISHHIWLRHFTNSIVLQRRPKRYARIMRARADISPWAQDHVRKQAHHKLLYIARTGHFLQIVRTTISPKLRVRWQHWVEIAHRRSLARGTNFPVWVSEIQYNMSIIYWTLPNMAFQSQWTFTKIYKLY
jgi:hypothetical protein